MSSDNKQADQPPGARMSSQMQAVMRVLTGQEERTIAQKMADSNRPTWEQYKKDNEDKLNMEGMDQKKMEEYRQQLDADREKRLARGTNHKRGDKKKKKRSRREEDVSSDCDDDSYRRRRKRHKKKRKKKHKKRSHEDDSSSASSDSEDRDEDRRRRHKRKKKKKRDKDDGEDSDGSHYRLSKFFQGSDQSD